MPNAEIVREARVLPEGRLTLLSRSEVRELADTNRNGLHELLRRCSLAVLNSGTDIDDAGALLDLYPDFDIRVLQQDRGIKLELKNAPAQAFVDGRIITGIRELLFAVLRDVAYANDQILRNPSFDLNSGEGITNAVFQMLRNARVMRPNREPQLVVCWGGHSISREEYDYTKEVGYHLGLRGMDICTGCGPGAMKGPMKGATIAHAKQRIRDGMYIGITEPGIIAAESPNPIVNELVIMPDIEKRLEAFVRLGHAIVIFPGGVGTCEELLYLLGILLHPDNREQPFPLLLTGPESARAYFEQIDRFVRATLGDQAASLYQIVVEDPVEVARRVSQGVQKVRQYRIRTKDAFFFNWGLHIREQFQHPFAPTHENMAALDIHRDQPVHELAADLRRLFSGIVAGNVKEQGLREVKRHGPYRIHGDPEIMRLLDRLLQSFVDQHRMKLPGKAYQPCYEVVT